MDSMWSWAFQKWTTFLSGAGTVRQATRTAKCNVVARATCGGPSGTPRSSSLGWNMLQAYNSQDGQDFILTTCWENILDVLGWIKCIINFFFLPASTYLKTRKCKMMVVARNYGSQYIPVGWCWAGAGEGRGSWANSHIQEVSPSGHGTWKNLVLGDNTQELWTRGWCVKIITCPVSIWANDNGTDNRDEEDTPGS